MKKTVSIFIIYFLIAVIYTFPLVFKLGSAIYGFSGDNLGAIHYLWWWKYTFINHLDIRNSFLEQAPFGFRVDSESGSVFYYWPLKLLTLISNQVLAYNLVLLLSFPLAALTMYLTVKSVLSRFFEGGEGRAKTAWIAFWAGLTFSFSPYHFWKAYNHLDLALIWSFPLSVLFLFNFLKEAHENKFSFKNIFGCAVSLAVTILTNFYYGFFLIITLALLAVCFWLLNRSNLVKVFSSLFGAYAVAFLLAVPFMMPTLTDAYVNKGAGQSAARLANYDRPVLDLVSLSARPWDYLVPSQDNPIFGRLSRSFYAWVKTQGKDFKVISGPVHERNIFLGYASIFLILVGAALLALNKEFRGKYGKVFLTLFLVILLLVLISMPPYIFLKGKYTFYLPSQLLYIFAPMFRTYARLGIFVLMLAVLAAAIVLKFLMEKLSRKALVFGGILFFIFSSVEFANVPPSKVIDLRQSNAFAYVGEQPGNFSFIVFPQEFNVAELLVFQPQFQKGFLNFHSQSPYYKLWNYLSNYKDPKVPRLLAALGIKYAVFQKKLLFATPNPVDDLWYTRALRAPLELLPPDYVLEKDFDDSAVYAINSEPLGFITFTKERTNVFPQAPLKSLTGETRIYFANLVDNKGLKFNLSFLLVNGGSLLENGMSAENIDFRLSSRQSLPQGEEVVVEATLPSPKGFINFNIGPTTRLENIEAEVTNWFDVPAKL